MARVTVRRAPGLYVQLVESRRGGPPVPPPPTFTFWDQAPPSGGTPEGLGAGNVIVGVRFQAVAAAVLRAVWFHSPPGATALPVRVNLWPDASGAAIVDQVAEWSGAAGSGWVRHPLATPVTLTAATYYRVGAYSDGVGGAWYGPRAQWWPAVTTPITAGPLSTGGSGGNFGVASTAGNIWPATVTHRNYGVDPEVTEG